jgi:hypothetical protein
VSKGNQSELVEEDVLRVSLGFCLAAVLFHAACGNMLWTGKERDGTGDYNGMGSGGLWSYRYACFSVVAG